VIEKLGVRLWDRQQRTPGGEFERAALSAYIFDFDLRAACNGMPHWRIGSRARRRRPAEMLTVFLPPQPAERGIVNRFSGDSSHKDRDFTLPLRCQLGEKPYKNQAFGSTRPTEVPCFYTT
jgi:hypothetical protein